MQLVKEKKAAAILEVAVQTLRNNRHKRRPPKYIKFGKSVRYSLTISYLRIIT